MSKQDDFDLRTYRRHLYQGWFGGILLVTLGALFLLQNFLNFDVFGKLWPVLLVVLGLGIIVSQTKKKS